MKIVNKKVKFEYTFIETHIVGIKLMGSEVKPIKSGLTSLTDTYCYFSGGELFVKGMYISSKGNSYSHEPIRDRKLLMKKRELIKLSKQLINGLTIVPYKIFVNERGLVKMEIVLAKGKKLHDKRQAIKERDIDRETRKKY